MLFSCESTIVLKCNVSIPTGHSVAALIIPCLLHAIQMKSIEINCQ